ncbi:B3 DNA binding domain [Dillenia turbinata]|uniref:Auxin response factor n=1 Tax=Dillenia turbinata TaxID=194707 RepID=A0AAN8VLP8_9MAGN
MKEVNEKTLDPQLWHACAGGMVQMPPINSKVFYFPQGHAEHANGVVDFGVSPRIPALVLCRVVDVKFMADTETDEVYAKIRLVPFGNNELDFDDDGILGGTKMENPEKPASFAKTLTQSDANNGGGFSVPRYCAETIFPRLDYSADPPVQTVIAKDVHGEVWKFRHIYRGTPRRHLLTTGWSSFVNHKKLVAGDSIVFLRAKNGDLCVGIRRAKRGIGGHDSPSGWNPGGGNSVSPYGGFSVFLREDESRMMRNGGVGCGISGGTLKGKSRVQPESVVEAATLAASGQPFEVVYYPHANTPEFCVKASAVRAAMRIQWSPGIRFKMAFETEDSSRISWFMGTLSSVQVADPIRWPNSPWRLLQVTWDEPDLLQNVKRVSPWLVELVCNMPVIHLSPFSPPRKKLRLPQPPDFPLDGLFLMPSFSSNPLGPSSPMCCLSDNTPAGIQGARHAQFGISLTDLHLNNKPQLGLVPSSFQQLNRQSAIADCTFSDHANSKKNVSCLLTMGNSSQNLEKSDNAKTPQFVLFGKPILLEQHVSHSSSSNAVSEVSTEKAKYFSDDSVSEINRQGPQENSPIAGFLWHHGPKTSDISLDIGHCKVFMESEDVGRTLDLSVLGSYEELYRRLANMFGIERPEKLGHVLYFDANGAVKHAGDEPFRKWITGMRNGENGINSPNKTGPLSIFA